MISWRRTLRELRNILVKHWFAISLFVIACALHFWYVIMHIDGSLYGGPGDHTAGIIWLYEQYPQSPWWHMTNAAGFPFPQNLWSPVYVVSQGFYVLYWLFAKIFGGAVAGYNMIVFAFITLSYVAVYLACLRVTKVGRVFSSIFSYTVSFSTFSLACIAVGHISYLLAPAWSIALVLCLVRLYTHDSVKWWVLGCAVVLLGGTWMFDPYFILFAWVIFAIITAALIFYYRANWKMILKRSIFTGILAGMLFIPVIVYGRIHQGAITQDTSAIRNNIDLDLMAYSARVEDYLLPAATNPLLPNSVADLKRGSFHNSLGFTLFIGIIPMIVFAVYGFTRASRKIKTKPSERERLYFVICGATALGLFALSLPPHIEIFNRTILLPSGILENFTSMWRVVARAYIFLMPPLLIVCAILLARLLKVWNRKKTVTVTMYAIAGLVAVAGSLVRSPFDSSAFWNIKTSLPTTYERVATDESIKVMAEYPLREQPHYRGSLYFTAQLYHHKKLFNSYQATTNEGLLRESLMDLNNPQTLPALRYFGVDTLQVWRNTSLEGEDHMSFLGQVNKIESTQYTSIFSRKDVVSLYRIIPKKDTLNDTFLSYLNFNLRPGDDRIVDIWQGMPQYFEVGIYDLCKIYPKPVCSQRPPVENIILEQHLKLRNTANDKRVITATGDGINKGVYELEAGGSKDIVIKRNADSTKLIGFTSDKPGGVEMSDNYTTVK